MTLFPENRLKKNADFLRVLRGKTKKVDGALGRVLAAERQSSAVRFGFVMSKKTVPDGRARNLLKRRASEWIRKRAPLFRDGLDIVFVFGKDSPFLSRRAFYEELERACGRAGLFR